MRRPVLAAALVLVLPAAASPALGFSPPPRDDPPRYVRAITSQGEVMLPGWGSLCWTYRLPGTGPGGFCADAPFLTPEILATYPRLRVAEGERVRFELNSLYTGASAPLAVGLGVESDPFTPNAPRRDALEASDPTYWTVAGEDGLLTLSVRYLQGTPSYVARLEVVRPEAPKPPPTPWTPDLCTQWYAKVAIATVKARAAYKVAKTTRKPTTRKRAYAMVTRLVKHRAGYRALIAQGCRGR